MIILFFKTYQIEKNEKFWTNIDLNNKNLNDNDIPAIFEALQYNEYAEKLNISNNNLKVIN